MINENDTLFFTAPFQKPVQWKTWKLFSFFLNWCIAPILKQWWWPQYQKWYISLKQYNFNNIKEILFIYYYDGILNLWTVSPSFLHTHDTVTPKPNVAVAVVYSTVRMYATHICIKATHLFIHYDQLCIHHIHLTWSLFWLHCTE